MDVTIAYAKTDLAWTAIRTRSVALSAAARAVLIMIDGKRPLAELLPAIEAMSLSLDDVRALERNGLVSPVAREPAPQQVESPTRVTPAPPAQPTSAPTPPTAAPAANRSLAAAKFYALEQIARLLGRQDEALRLAARDVVDHHSLLDWLDHCRQAIADIAGEERAHLLVARTHALMPEAPATAG